MDDSSKSPMQLLVQERTGRQIDELLRELYVDERHSQAAIAKAFTATAGRRISRTTISAWLADLGITRADRPAVAL